MTNNSTLALALTDIAAKATADKLSRRLKGGDLRVVPDYRAATAAVRGLADAEIVELPAAGTLDELWDSLGFPDLGGQPTEFGGIPGVVWASGHRDIRGVHRRLAAALRSIRSRGTAESEFLLSAAHTNGSKLFVWESPSGAWTRRHWKVTGRLRLVGGRVVADQVVVAVESTARREEGIVEWTAFTGGALDSSLSERLNWVIAQFAARRLQTGASDTEGVEWNYPYGRRRGAGWTAPRGWRPVSLTDDELEAYHDLHTSPMAAWRTPVGRVLLEDDTDGSARLHCPDAAVQELVRLFWANAPKADLTV